MAGKDDISLLYKSDDWKNFVPDNNEEGKVKKIILV